MRKWTLRRMARQALAALSLAGLLTPARAQTISFDDLAGNNTAIPNGYNGMSWTSFRHLKPSAYPVLQSSGYMNGVVCAPIVAYAPGFNLVDPVEAAFESLNPFNLNSVYMTAAWRNGLNVQISGYNGVNLVNQQVVQLNPYGPMLVGLNWNNLTRVHFSSIGGTPTQASKDGYQFVIDDLKISPFNGSPDVSEAPEPGSLALLAGGAVPLGLGFLRRFRR